MYKLLSFFLTFFYLGFYSSNLSILHAAEPPKTIAQQLMEQMETTNTNVCVIGFNVGRANTFIHINKVTGDIFIIDCGYKENQHYAEKIVDIIDGFCNLRACRTPCGKCSCLSVLGGAKMMEVLCLS